MSRFVRRTHMVGLLLLLFALNAFIASTQRQTLPFAHASSLSKSPYHSYQDFTRYITSRHAAPFQPVAPFSGGQRQVFARQQQPPMPPGSNFGHNVRVNRDLNPWGKNTIAAAINPARPQNYVVVTNDYRENYSHQYYHVSDDGGRTWRDDALTNGIDAVTSAPYSLQSNPSVAFDPQGNSLISTLSANIIADATTSYSNFDTQIDLVQGYNNTTYTSFTTTVIDYVPCSGILSPTTVFNCPGQLQRPFLAVDTVPGSPHFGSIYVYYTYFCNGVTATPTGTATPQPVQPCVDGPVSIPPLSSAILEVSADGPGMPFSKPRLVSSPAQTQAAYANMVIDEQGTPHIFFENFTGYPTAELFMATLKGEEWEVSARPLVSMQYLTLGTNGWNFYGNSNPGCSVFEETAYCAFAANKVDSGPTYGTPNVYLLSVDTQTLQHTTTRVNNDGSATLKAHFFPWASTNSEGTVYVGWYDNRHDPYNTRVEYFVGRSTDGGHSFPKQQAVSDGPFNPCIGSPYCSYFGDYTQLVTGPDDVTHATWVDTRDQVGAQLYTQALSW